MIFITVNPLLRNFVDTISIYCAGNMLFFFTTKPEGLRSFF